MERKKYISLLISLFITLSCLANSNQEKVYLAYVNNTMSEWKKIIDTMEKTSLANNQTRLELLNYQYGYIAWCLGQKKHDEATIYLRRAEKHIDALDNKKYKPADLHAYKAAFYGYKIAITPFKASYLGPKSIWHVKKALEIEPENMFALLQYGNIYYYMPVTFGGSKETASQYYLKVEKWYEKHPQQRIANWNYINVLVTLTNTYIALGKKDKATEYYNKIVTAEPTSSWIKQEIYPQLK